ncbi:hypothetical protein [Paludibaculum fermentans]|uniref:UbiA prenyltransferase n=1 Tax=Paludibaculum fermentans TaxID=1473598 RepID=A0A7S7SND4_PALFE|nr:hypothetical protein [Paludibaculum fermentans]QOY90818.1 hypothetical protein IRI77_12985 [Paludibaculum fermentans]
MAVLWQALVARYYSLPLRPVAHVVLFLTVWAIYLSDRLLDVRKPATSPESPRHLFYRRHRSFGLVLLVLVLVFDSALCLFELRPAVRHAGWLALAGVLLYLGLVHLFHLQALFPKQFVAAILFGLGTFVAPWALSPDPRRLLIPWLFFVVLCLGNLVAIEGWEWRDLNAGEPPQAVTRVLQEWLRLWMPAAGVVALGFAGQRYFQAVAASAAGITAISLYEHRISLDLRRVLVDAALLTPFIFYWL